MLTLFTKPDCPACAELKAWLEGQDIHYKEADVEKNPEAAQFLRYLNPRNPGKATVPALALNGRVLFGFAGGERERKWLEGHGVLRNQTVGENSS